MPHVPATVEVLHLEQLSSLREAADDDREDFAVLQIELSNCRSAVGWLMRSGGRGVRWSVAAVGAECRGGALALVEAGAVGAFSDVLQGQRLGRLVRRHFRARKWLAGPRMDEIMIGSIVQSAVRNHAKTS